MKITKTKLREMIKQELKEISGTAGGTKAIQQGKKADTKVKTAKSTKRSKKSAYDTAKKTYTTKSSAYDTAGSDYNTKAAAVDAFNVKKYRKAGARRGTWDYSKNPIKGGEVNPDWTTKNNAKSAALTTKNTRSTAKDTADSDQSSAETDYDSAVSDLSDAETAQRMAKAQTSFAVSAGGGGRKGGKAGVGKKGGKKKTESLHKILGRKLVNEIKDLKKYKK